MAGSSIPQELLAEVNAVIDESYNNTENDEIQLQALKKSLRFLTELPSDIHILCNPLLEKVVVKALLVFAYPNTEHLTFFQAFLGPQLARCPQCPRKFHIYLLELERIMSETYSYEPAAVDQLMKCFDQWNQERLLSKLTSLHEKMKEIEFPKPSDFGEELIPLFECLCAPRLLKKSEELHNMFTNVFFGIQQASSPGVRPPELLPGVISFLFSSDSQERTWAQVTVNKIKPSEFSTASTFDTMLVQAVDDVVSTVSKSYQSEEQKQQFWIAFNVLIKVLDKSVFTEKLNGRDHDILRYLAGAVLTLSDTVISQVLLALGKAIDKLGSNFWPLISPVTVEYIVNAIRGNASFSSNTAWNTNSPNDIVSWVSPLLKSCDSTNLQRCGAIIAPLLINQLNSKPPVVEESITVHVLNVFNICMKVEMRKIIPFIPQVLRLQRTSIKNLVNHYANLIIHSYSKFKVTNIFIPTQALEVIYFSILLDVAAGTPENPGLKDSTPTSDEEKPRQGLESLWAVLNNSMPQDSQIAIHVLKALKGIPFIMRPPTRKPNEVHIMPRGEYSENAIKYSIESLQLIGEFDTETLQPVIKDDDSLLSIILNMYSVNQEVNQSATDILCQAFDADDRLTALTAMLNFDTQRSLKILTDSVFLVTEVSIFPPCPKLIKVAQDVSQCLFGAKVGVLNKKISHISQSLLQYWETTWKFLEKMFKTTPKWASHFKNDIMLEFMRDLLDYSGELVDYYRLLESLMPVGMSGTTSNNYLLLNPVIDCLTEMCRLLRLRDESLILSCFNIIISVLGLMKSFDVKPSEALVNIFKQLSTRARGYENVLTINQLTRLLVDSGINTPDEAERAVRRAASPTNQSDSVETKSIKPSQKSIMDFTRPGVPGAPHRPTHVAPSIPVQVRAVAGSAAPRTSMMDTLRAEVLNSRSAMKPSSVSKIVHAARPAGFNSKSGLGRKAMAKDESGSSSDNDSDSSGDEGLFTLKKASEAVHRLRNIEKKQVGVLNLGPSKSRFGESKLSDKEREERNMRARLNVNLDSLYKQILSWDYHNSGDQPIIQKTGKLFKSDARRVPDKFTSVKEYQEVFGPLLMLECWQGIQRAKMEANENPFIITIANKTVVGNGAYEVRASVPGPILKDSKIGDSDLLVLSYFGNNLKTAANPSKDVPYCFAKIKEIKNVNSDFAELALRVDDPPTNVNNQLIMSSEFHVLRTTGLTTIEREYCSLMALPYYDLQSEILGAIPSLVSQPSASAIANVVDTYGVNESQAKAIICTKTSSGFSLIQGYVITIFY